MATAALDPRMARARPMHRTDVLFAKCNRCLLETEDNSIWPVVTQAMRCTRCRSRDLDIEFRVPALIRFNLSQLDHLPF